MYSSGRSLISLAKHFMVTSKLDPNGSNTSGHLVILCLCCNFTILELQVFCQFRFKKFSMCYLLV